MLVLSRRPNEKILFPTLDVSVQVLSVRPGSVRLGIEAPPEVKVLRQELHEQHSEWNHDRADNQREPSPSNCVRNRLRIAALGLGELRRHAEAGRTEDALATLARLEEDLQMLARRLESEEPTRPALVGACL